MRSLDFFRPRGALVRSHTFFKACMCGEVGIRRLGFLWLGDFLSNSKKLVDLQNIQELKFHKNVNSSHQNGFTQMSLL